MKRISVIEKAFEISNGVTVQKWIPVSERLPREESMLFQKQNGEDPTYIVMINGAQMPTTLFFDPDNNLWYEMRDDGEVVGYTVTHWMPMPLPLKECE